LKGISLKEFNAVQGQTFREEPLPGQLEHFGAGIDAGYLRACETPPALQQEPPVAFAED
jgi:hypothetical protein